VEGVRSGVEVLEDIAECGYVGGRTRFARRKVKKAVVEDVSFRTSGYESCSRAENEITIMLIYLEQDSGV
jgi:hypothetical protein